MEGVYFFNMMDDIRDGFVVFFASGKHLQRYGHKSKRLAPDGGQARASGNYNYREERNLISFLTAR